MGLVSSILLCALLSGQMLSPPGEAAEEKLVKVRAYCLPDELFLDGFCFHYFEDSLRYKEASCRSLRRRATLATIQDDQKLKIIASYLQGFTNIPEVWIGLHQAKDLSWQWADKSRFNYTAWHLGFPEQSSRRSCTVLSIKEGFQASWLVQNCHYVL